MCLIPKYFSSTKKQREFACRGKRNSACAIGKNLCILFLVQESYSTRKTWPCRSTWLSSPGWAPTLVSYLLDCSAHLSASLLPNATFLPVLKRMCVSCLQFTC